MYHKEHMDRKPDSRSIPQSVILEYSFAEQVFIEFPLCIKH